MLYLVNTSPFFIFDAAYIERLNCVLKTSALDSSKSTAPLATEAKIESLTRHVISALLVEKADLHHRVHDLL